MNRAQFRYLLSETLISVVINSVMSLVAAWLAFGGADVVPTFGVRGVFGNLVPQAFMVSLMGSIVPTLLTRARLRRGRLMTFTSDFVPSFTRLGSLCVAIAIVSALLVAILASVLLPLAGDGWWLSSAMLFVLACAIALSIVVTPLAIKLVFAPPAPGAQSQPQRRRRL